MNMQGLNEIKSTDSDKPKEFSTFHEYGVGVFWNRE